ncbi:MAG: DUF1232 domain-containing protein [Actinomycetota bacterium]|nr:DUF1232 domain-containing protein [Actinomycetota bacterium]
MDGEIIPLPNHDLRPTEDGQAIDSVPAEASLAVIRHPLDSTHPVPRRTRQDILKEAVLLVPNLAKLLARLLLDKRVPRMRRLAMTAVGAYVISPIDLIPDYIPVVGRVDDVLMLAFAVDFLLRESPPEVLDEHWDGSEDGLELVRGMAAWGSELLPDRLRRLVDRG